MVSSYGLHRITVDEYHRMDDAAIFPHDARIELIDGKLIERIVSMKPAHASAVEALDDALRTIVADRALIRCQMPVTLGDFSEPEPDFCIVSGSRPLYRTRHPNANEILAVIEVSDSSRDFDVRRKVPMYASFLIPEVWVVDLVDSCIRIYREPIGGEYRSTSIMNNDENVALLSFPEIETSVRAILG